MLEELYLIRHAAPDRNTGVPYQIHPGPPLTEAGQREAAELAIWLETRGVEHVFASPFERTTQTAAAIIELLGIDVTFVEGLREGAPGEPMEQITTRVAAMLAQVEDSPLRCVTFVTHGACVKALLQHTTANRIDLVGHNYDSGNVAPTAGVWQGTRFDHMWRWELIWRPGQAQVLEQKTSGIGPSVLL